MDEERIPRPHGSPLVAGTMVACGGALLWVAVAAANVRAGGGELLGQEGASLWVVPMVFALYGLLWRAPWPAAGLTWLGVEAAVILSGLLATPGTGWGPFLWYATAAGFVAGFAAFVGSWIRSAGQGGGQWGPRPSR